MYRRYLLRFKDLKDIVYYIRLKARRTSFQLIELNPLNEIDKKSYLPCVISESLLSVRDIGQFQTKCIRVILFSLPLAHQS